MTFYRPLHSINKGDSFRLCSLLPAGFEDAITCHIEPFNLDNGPEFEALSYTWGDALDRLPIEINGETILVTKNLATALTYLRNETHARTLWIDAICINQNDHDERNMQVALMGKIYRTARRVISWLGTRGSFFDPFIEMEYATSLFEHIKFLKEYPPFKTYLEGNDFRRPYPDFENHKRTFNNGLYSLQLLIGEREREKPAYWQRAWIIQEVASAQALVLQSGTYIISEEEIDLVTDFISSPKVAMLLMGERYDHRKFRSRLQSDMFVPISIYRTLLYPSEGNKGQRAARARGSLQLLTLLRHNRSRFCADKRDKVYSVLGLSDLTNINHSGLSVDYSKPISEVYIGAVQAIIQTSSTLEALCSANLAETTALPGLPSWVPNWSTHKNSDICERPVSYGQQNASRSMQANFRFWIDGTTHVLSATGFCFGSVVGFKDPFVELGEDMAHGEPISRLLNYASLYRQLSQGYEDMAKHLQPKPLSPSLFRHTCSLGLLRHDIDGSFKSFMDGLDLKVGFDETREPIKFSDGRFRLKLMASSINGQCMFAVKPHTLRESAELREGTIGIAPPGIIQKGDLVCIIFGCSAPLVLRPLGNRHLVVCACYIDTLMDGKAITFLEDGLFSSVRFDIE